MSCRASFHFPAPGQALPRRRPGLRPWRRLLTVPMTGRPRCEERTVPSGASTGTDEAVEPRDGGRSRYHGKGVVSVPRPAAGARA
ncbi:hypothetical protein ABJI51_23270 [Amycolatopsis sp. NEAU-NG30]|uniref:Uncharacterized protein n=1 Tax=Amycolatopsis melonis TaxID=3156488 RepID=A0ABV0LI87_9PSEU